MDSWKTSFLDKLHDAQSRCAKQFEQALDTVVTFVFDDLAQFLRDNNFEVSKPLSEEGRRSFKAGLAENAYVLMIFRFAGVGEFELRTETFVPGAEPALEKCTARVADITTEWAEKQFQTALDHFVELLARKGSEKPVEDLVAV